MRGTIAVRHVATWAFACVVTSCGESAPTGGGPGDGGVSAMSAASWPMRAQCSGGEVVCACEGGGTGVATCRSGRYGACVCAAGCTPRSECRLPLRELRLDTLSNLPGSYQDACGAVPDGCGGTLQCASCPESQTRSVPVVHGGVAVGAGRYFVGIAHDVGTTAWLIVEVDIESGMILRSWQTPRYNAFALDASLRYLVYARERGDYLRYDLVTGREELFATFRHTDGSVPRILAIYNLRSSESRWLVSVQMPASNAFEVWMVDRGTVVARSPGRSSTSFYELTNGTLLSIRSDISNLTLLDRQLPFGNYEVLPAGLQGPRDIRTAAVFGMWSCDGSLCYVSQGGRVDFGVTQYPPFNRTFTESDFSGVGYDGATGEVLLTGQLPRRGGGLQNFIGRAPHTSLSALQPTPRADLQLFDVEFTLSLDYIRRVSADQVLVGRATGTDLLIRHPLLRR